MSFEAHITALVTGDAATAAIIGNRMGPISGAQAEAKPLVCYDITNAEDPSPTLRGPSGYTRISFDIAIVTYDYEQAVALTTELQRLFDGHTGNSSGVNVRWTKFDGITDIEQQPEPGTERPIFVRTISYRSLYLEA